jgi:hypothetical protein
VLEVAVARSCIGLKGSRSYQRYNTSLSASPKNEIFLQETKQAK